jgi:hypothetical protein
MFTLIYSATKQALWRHEVSLVCYGIVKELIHLLEFLVQNLFLYNIIPPLSQQERSIIVLITEPNPISHVRSA